MLTIVTYVRIDVLNIWCFGVWYLKQEFDPKCLLEAH